MNNYQHFNCSLAPEVQTMSKNKSIKTIIIAICLSCLTCCLFIVCFGAIILLAKDKPIKQNVEATKTIEDIATTQPTERTLPITEYTETPVSTTTPIPTVTIVATEMPPEKPQIGYTAPDFSLESMNGEQVQLSSLRGSPVVLNFWTSWCGYCLDEMPDFQKAYDTYKNDGLIILAINVTVDDTRNDAINCMNEFGYSIPVLFDDNGDTMRKYNVNGYPNSFFVDPLGIIQDVAYGYIDAYTLESMLQSILN
jgi:peroxiredoxin